MPTIGSLSADLTADTASFEAGLNRARRSLASTQAQMNRATAAIEKGFQGINTVVGALGIGLSAAGIAMFVRNTLNAAGGLGELAEQLGISTDALQTYQFAAAQSGATTQELEAGIARFTKTIGEAREGNDAAVEAVRALGTEFAGLVASGASVDTLLLAFADAISKVDDRTVQAARGADLMGRGFQKLLPVFSQGRSGIAEFADALDRTGSRLSPELIANADKAADAIAAMEFQAGKFAQTMVAKLAPGITAVFAALNRMMSSPDIKRVEDAITDLEGRVASFREQMEKGGAKGILGPMIERSEAQLVKLKEELEKLRAAAATPAGASPPGGGGGGGAAPAGGGLLSDREKRKAEDAKKIVRDLELERDSIGKTKSEILRLRMERELDIEATARAGVAVRKYSDEQVAAAVNIQQEIESREKLGESIDRERDRRIALGEFNAEQERQIEQLNEQIAAAGRATVEFDKLTGTYRVYTRELDIVNEKQRILNQNLGHTAEEAEELARKNVEAQEKLKRAGEVVDEQAARMSRAQSEVTAFGERVFDHLGQSITDATLAGEEGFLDLKKVALSVLRELQLEIIKLAAFNPIKNAVFGGNSPSLFDIAGLFSGGFSIPGFATGTDHATSGLAWVGERGRELVNFGGGEQVMRGDEIGRSGGDTYYIDARGADREGLRNLERKIDRLDASVENRAMAATADGNLRGGGFRRAMKR